MSADNSSDVEAQIDQWRSYLHHRQAIHATDVEELEGHLRDQVAELADVGLNEDEAFLIAVKRMGNLDALSREFAREHSDRLWKQIVLAPSAEGKPGGSIRVEILVVLAYHLDGMSWGPRPGAGEGFDAFDATWIGYGGAFVPESSTFALGALGLLGLVGKRRNRSRRCPA